MGQADVGGAWGLRLDSKMLIQDTVLGVWASLWIWCGGVLD